MKDVGEALYHTEVLGHSENLSVLIKLLPPVSLVEFVSPIKHPMLKS